MVSSPVLTSKPLSVQRRQENEKSSNNTKNPNNRPGTSPTDAVDILKRMVASFDIQPDQAISSSSNLRDQSKDAKRRAYKRRMLNKQKKAAKNNTTSPKDTVNTSESSSGSSLSSSSENYSQEESGKEMNQETSSSGSDSETSQTDLTISIPETSGSDQTAKTQQPALLDTETVKKEQKKTGKKEKKNKRPPTTVAPKLDATSHHPVFYQHSALRKLDLIPAVSPSNVLQQCDPLLIKPIRQPIGPNGRDCGFSLGYRRSRTVTILA